MSNVQALVKTFAAAPYRQNACASRSIAPSAAIFLKADS
jgi:hypothetical protein